jgi:RHS repeat-associated protein
MQSKYTPPYGGNGLSGESVATPDTPRSQDSSGTSNSLPSISLPKGGGAIRGIGEKFAANPVTGTGSLSVPIYASPGRGGFGPQLSLSYDSGASNGAFGLGWSLGLPSLTRKTDKGLPQYADAEESDTFILSGAEDLVPLLVLNDGDWVRQVSRRTVFGTQYEIHSYRPRVEGLFARIERWLNVSDPTDTFWRSITRDNITTWYGKTEDSRVMDPNDPTRVFSWLICETYDDKGNLVLYQYKKEDSTGVDLSQAHERNRSDLSRSANRYLKRALYGNRTAYYPDLTAEQPTPYPNDWCFELVFDYGEHDTDAPVPDETAKWLCRADPFSTYRPTFEVRTYRLCRRALMFHHFPNDSQVGGNCLVRSTDFTHSELTQPLADPTKPFYSFLVSVQQTAYQRNGNGGYVSKGVPPLQFEYTDAVIDETVRELDPDSIGNLPSGLDGARCRWIDLDGEGLPGILTEQGGSWYYKPNLSPTNQATNGGVTSTRAQFGPEILVSPQPSLAALGSGRQQLLDLSGNGHLDLVQFDAPAPGFFERSNNDSWRPFASFERLPVLDWGDPNLKFIDLTGDGHADLLISEDAAFWWHDSLATEGFGAGQRVSQASDEERGPKLLFADAKETIFLADLAGDGLTDLVRIRNGEVCYWPNLGYGRFGAKVTMDGAPWFDTQDLFDGRRIHLADIDGSGTADMVYFANGSVHLYFNQSGNAWGAKRRLDHFPRVESSSYAAAVDLLGNGTACLVWSSPLPGNAAQPMRYIDLMGGQKPHLLVRSTNNLGSETRVEYVPSIKFYVADKLAGTPWVTRIPFPVHVVEHVETFDYISRNRFVTRYAYHHGYYDGVEREFRGFGRVDQQDTEEFGTLTESGGLPEATNIDAASNVPPVLTKTWFHTGVFLGGERVSRHLEHEYYREGDLSDSITGLTEEQLDAMLLPDTVLPTTILLPDSSRQAYPMTGEEIREACRALRGSILRQEVYGLDGTDASDRPYSVSESNYTLEIYQPQGPNKYAVFLAHPRESIDFHYERKLFNVIGNTLTDASDPNGKKAADPRVMHAFTLAVDTYGNVLQSAAVGYGRRYLDPGLTPEDQAKQSSTLVTSTEASFTNPLLGADVYRTPLPAETSTYELLQVQPEGTQPGVTNLFGFDEIAQKLQMAGDGAHDIAYQDPNPSGLAPGQPYRRLLKRQHTLYRPDDMGQSAGAERALLPLGTVESLALPGCSYGLAFTPGLIAQVYQRAGTALLPDPAAVFASVAEDGGGNVDLDGNGNWWIPSGRVYYLPAPASPPDELAEARKHFFLPRRLEDPFGHPASVDYDANDLLPVQAADALLNTTGAVYDYRVLQPKLITDANDDRTAVSFDLLGLVAGTAVMGKTSENLGDSLATFTSDLTQQQIDDFYSADDPHTLAGALLGSATTRIVYDENRFLNSRASAPDDPTQWQPVFAATLARETHVSDLAPGQETKIQIGFGYSDGFGREIQKKVQAEPAPGADAPRWAGSGWTIFNNKGKPVRQYEPFFSVLPAKGHQFEFGVQVGVSPILCYDPVTRVVATVHPDHTYEKVVFDPWRQDTWDANDTVLQTDPAADPDVGDLFERLPHGDYSPTWYSQRSGGGLGALEQKAANKAAAHANTPATAYFDSLGRPFLTIADNGPDGKYQTRVELDIEGNQRSVTDALGRKVMVYDYDMLGNRIHQASMEAGERWSLNDVLGKPIRAWDTRGDNFRTAYDELRRPKSSFVFGTDAVNSDPRTTAAEVLFEKTAYGEGQPNDKALNLRTRVFQHFDSAGVVTSFGHNPATNQDEAYDFKGNLLRASRQFVQDYQSLANWSAVPPSWQPDIFTSSTQYDALNRPVSKTTPDGSVYHPTYNEANLLETVSVNLQGAQVATPFVTNIDYNAKGRRVLIEYGNGALTEYEYDSETFRLTHLKTTRQGFPADERIVQDLKYTYDPVGNITHIQDDAQDTIFFSNQRVEPSNDYTYDALYRLIHATGREHLGQHGDGTLLPPAPTSYNDAPRIQLHHPDDTQAMGTYEERYDYDPVGNFQHYIHKSSALDHPGWTRSYAYAQVSLLESDEVSNRLSSTTVGNDPPEVYPYDIHGNMLAMPHLSRMDWDFKDQLRHVNLGGGGEAYYVYDAGGQRVRKVVEKNNGTLVEEQIYLGAFEVFRRRDGTGTVTLERETLHVMDDKQRVALIEIKTVDAQSPVLGAQPLVRYQFSNHLGSASLELDESEQIISYEEYYPYGSTSYQAVSTVVEVSPKRYRYTGMERDEETGLNYHGARYYAVWLGRWTTTDPALLLDGLNLYRFTRDNPIVLRDPAGTDSHQSLVDEMASAIESRHKYGGFVLIGKEEEEIVGMFLRVGEGSLDQCSNHVTKKEMFDLGVQVFLKRYPEYAERFWIAAQKGDELFEAQNARLVSAYDDYYMQCDSSRCIVTNFYGTADQHRAFSESRINNRNLLPRVSSELIGSFGSPEMNHPSEGALGNSTGREYQSGAPLEPVDVKVSTGEGGSGGGGGGGGGSRSVPGGTPMPFTSLVSGYEAMSGTRNGIIVDPVRVAGYENLAVGRFGGVVAIQESDSSIWVSTSSARNRSLAHPTLQSIFSQYRHPFNFGCAEVGNLSATLYAGMDPQGSTSGAFHIAADVSENITPYPPDSTAVHLSPMQTCEGCRVLLNHFGITFNH